jgi:diguanylate cyclase (GGDEF)-like protein
MHNWNDDELELKILETYIQHYEDVKTRRGGDAPIQCESELDIGSVLARLTRLQNPELDRRKEEWYRRLVETLFPQEDKPLRCCSDTNAIRGPHRWHARAFASELGQQPAWERARVLRNQLALNNKGPIKEPEQKFKILWSVSQAEQDFNTWIEELGTQQQFVAVLFIDIDHFKDLNTRYTEATIDKTILPSFMRLLRDYCRFRAEVYRYGGDEFLILLPNYDFEDATRFAEKLRVKVAVQDFPVNEETEHITVSLGLAFWPRHGTTYSAVLQVANNEKNAAKQSRNTLKVAT